MNDTLDTRYSITNCTEEQVREVGGTDLKTARFSRIIFAQLTDEQAKKLEQGGCVINRITKIKTDTSAPVISPPHPAPVAATPTYSASELMDITGLSALRDLFDPPLYGEGVNVAIIGTGIRETHQQIAGSIVYSKNFTSSTMRDGFNHDTGVASMIVSIVPRCGILNLKVIDDSGEGDEEAVVMAIEECIELHDQQSPFAPTVINLSLGAPDDGNVNSPMRIACRTATSIGILVFAAAGNTGPGVLTVMSPACERYVIAVGSVRYIPDPASFIISDFSSRGPTQENIIKPDAVLFGEDIIMASSESDTAMTYKSGTSFSCPIGAAIGIIYVEGVTRKAMTLVEFGGLPPAQMYYVPVNEIVDSYFPRICVKPQGVAAAKDDVYGSGMPYGPYLAQAIQSSMGAGIGASLSSLLPVMMILPMMAAMMKSMSKPEVK